MIFLKLFLNFLKIGLFTIGGGYAMIPLIQDTVVSNGWLTSEQLIDFIAIAESTPGPFAINVATFVGTTIGATQLGVWGSVIGVLATVGGLFVPSFVIIFTIYKLSSKFLKANPVQDAMTSIRPTVVALILTAFVTVAISTLMIASDNGKSFNWFGLIWFAICFAVMQKFKKVPVIAMILVSAGVGIVFYGFIL